MRDMSILFYWRPRETIVSVVGAGAALLSDDRLTDGNPGVETAIQWVSGAADIGDYVAVRQTWSAPQPLRGGWALGLRFEGGSYPAGAKVRAFGRVSSDPDFDVDLGGNSQSAETYEQRDGSIAVLFLFDADLPEDFTGWEVQYFNDAGGATFATAASVLRIGEMDCAEGVPVRVRDGGWSTAVNVTVPTVRTLASQMHEADGRTNWRTVSFEYVPTDGAEVRRGGLRAGQDWERIESRLTRARARAMLYARVRSDGDDSLDVDQMNSSAYFGKYRPDAIPNVSRDMYSGGGKIDEVPALVD